ncbi:hypothetical protein QI633_11230 [Nocardioides sp. QY071]|uniref:hypothetical protein n=1 Tax=Nocardioides sp. QY071 TaxID=3044187 RepID=UPI00249C7F52|nr:hypothetical protein [Nocardioides sp. QY071]WGY04318.1 hypothetical protein QI633_11230 [Nocardioides sp. QY071]
MLKPILRLHCKTHPDETLAEFWTEAEGWWDPRVKVPADLNLHHLVGPHAAGTLHESVQTSMGVSSPTFRGEESVVPAFRGKPGTTWEENWLIPLPDGYVWDQERGVAYPEAKLDGDRHVDLKRGSGIGTRYRARCPRQGCTAPTMRKVRLLGVLEWVHDRRDDLVSAITQDAIKALGHLPQRWKIVDWPDGVANPDGVDLSWGGLVLEADWDTLLKVVPKGDASV